MPRQPIPRVCFICAGTFVVDPDDEGTCSPVCRDAAIAARRCLGCGTSIADRQRNALYCVGRCKKAISHAKARARQLITPDPCAQCGEPIDRQERPRSIVCSPECLTARNAELRRTKPQREPPLEQELDSEELQAIERLTGAAKDAAIEEFIARAEEKLHRLQLRKQREANPRLTRRDAAGDTAGGSAPIRTVRIILPERLEQPDY